jgi:hypothetical protein
MLLYKALASRDLTMKIKKFLVAAALLVSAPAQAATFFITYVGTVNGYDETGLFGTAGPLTGDFEAVFTLTTGLPNVSRVSGPRYASEGGYRHFSLPAPLQAQLTINGVTKEYPPAYFGEVQVGDGNGGPFPHTTDYMSHWIWLDPNDSDSQLRLGFASLTGDLFHTTEYTAPFDITISPPLLGSGTFHLLRDGFAYGDLSVQRVWLEAAAPAIPEPATWAMMLLGFAAVGAAVRRQRHHQAKVTFAF